MSEIPFFYSNVARIAMSQNDITFDFGHKSPEQSSAGPDVFDTIARISMSPSHAKHLLLILKGLIDNFEQRIGEIPLEKDNLDKYNEIFKKKPSTS
jgi:hypothetical protein